MIILFVKYSSLHIHEQPKAVAAKEATQSEHKDAGVQTEPRNLDALSTESLR
jgi:hypothetical protein